MLLCGARDAPPVLSTGLLTWPRLWAAAIAMALTLAILVPAKASHPPATAPPLLIALGGFPVTLREIGVLVAGVLLVAILGEGARRLRHEG